jgi:translation elongation factor EF-4
MLADRLLETTGTIGVSSGNKQVLDKLQVEQERGITVKAQTATMFYTLNDKPYLLNLIDTPGHVDFNYEVCLLLFVFPTLTLLTLLTLCPNQVRCSLAACQGCLLVVDATQGVQAQTVANYHLANDLKLAIIPVINKIDMPIAEVEKTKQQLKAIFNFDEENIICVSAKTGT